MDLPSELERRLIHANLIADEYGVRFDIKFSRKYRQEERHRLIAQRLRGNDLSPEQEATIWQDIDKMSYVATWTLTRTSLVPLLWWKTEDKAVVAEGSSAAVAQWLKLWIGVAERKAAAKMSMSLWLHEHPGEHLVLHQKRKRWILEWNLYDG